MIKSWMVIGGITLLLALLSNFLITPQGSQWFRRLRRPNWLTFESAIPLIWTVIFIFGAWSAVVTWEENPGGHATWVLMGCYLLLEIVTLSYTPLMLWLRRLRVGIFIGATGAIIGVLLLISIWPISRLAALLLLPYLLWSPIGTYTTWEMSRLNPLDA